MIPMGNPPAPGEERSLWHRIDTMFGRGAHALMKMGIGLDDDAIITERRSLLPPHGHHRGEERILVFNELTGLVDEHILTWHKWAIDAQAFERGDFWFIAYCQPLRTLYVQPRPSPGGYGRPDLGLGVGMASWPG